MGSITAAALLLLLLATVPAVLAVTFQVGDTAGWNSGVDYTTWVSGKTFRVGDTLEFQYGPSHSVAVVDKAGFDGCDDSGATQRFSGGDTKFDLTTVGTIHFLCPSPGHCLGGMKLAVPSSPPLPLLHHRLPQYRLHLHRFLLALRVNVTHRPDMLLHLPLARRSQSL